MKDIFSMYSDTEIQIDNYHKLQKPNKQYPELPRRLLKIQNYPRILGVVYVICVKLISNKKLVQI